MRSTNELSVDELQDAIQSVTARRPVSRDPSYLRHRLSSLRQRSQDGEDLRAVPGSNPPVIASISMPSDAREAVNRLIERRGCGLSELVRRALAEWAARNGFKVEAKVIDQATK